MYRTGCVPKATKPPCGGPLSDLLRRYADWLHLRWPAGRVEPMPEVREGGATAVPGLYVAGDLIGVPLLKPALDSGARVVRTLADDPATRAGDGLDLLIIGGGVAGMAAALEAKAAGLRFEVLEAAQPFATIADFPARKPIFTYPTDMTPAGVLQVTASTKEALLAELLAQAAAADIAVTRARAERVVREAQTLRVMLQGGGELRARRVLVATGASGEHRRLGVSGEDLPHVSHRLIDAAMHRGQAVVVVGGGDSALEAALALAQEGARVTLVHRRSDLARAKSALADAVQARASASPEPGRIHVRLGASVTQIAAEAVSVQGEGGDASVPAAAVYLMLGRAAPLEFFRRSGVPIRGERGPAQWAAFAAFVAFCVWLYDWKSGGFFSNLWYAQHWFPTDLPQRLAAAGGAFARDASDPATLLGTLAISASSPSFYYTLAYSIVVTVFGVQRIRRRRTPYVTAQTLTLIAIQVLPLFVLPEILLPLLDQHGLLWKPLADALFPVVNYGHGREFWRAYGFILAWPLDVYNLFTHQPLPWWIAIGFVQTCVLIPLGVLKWGKGFYCGWICSCGALAETLGDTHRQKMPHGPESNRWNMVGQGVLALAVILLLVRIAGWILPAGNAVAGVFEQWCEPGYKWTIDVFLAGVVGYGAYFAFSGRIWCRFACPLAAWMHIVARFSHFAILPEKAKCISCNQCTSECHMGIDVMAFASRGLPMQDPECVRCSACVHVCPTGVLQFGELRSDGFVSLDTLAASPVRMREKP
jgi:thioredoxin reductase/NAD-dependent dihydropyrimidine dehydrogenase PreA subunit